MEMASKGASGSSKMSQSPLPTQPIPIARCSSPVTAAGNPDIPMWLLSSLSDLDERLKEIAISSVDVPDCGDSFAQRAEAYYLQRPQLLSLLQDMYNAYAYLSDRYIQTLIKKNHNHPNKVSNHILDIGLHDFHDQEEEVGTFHVDSDAESSLSYQRHLVTLGPSSILKTNSDVSIDRNNIMKVDQLVSKLVIKNVEYDVLENEADILGRHSDEFLRKIKEQKNLIEELESEQRMLQNQNSRLYCKLSAVERMNFEIESEAVYMREKAGELATKLKEEQAMPKNAEDLQRKISELEKKNKEYRKQLERRNLQIRNQNRNDPPEMTQECLSFSMFRRRRSKRESCS